MLPASEIPGFHAVRALYRSATTVVARAIRDGDHAPVVLKYAAHDAPALRDEAARCHEYDLLRDLASPHVIRVLDLIRRGNRLVLVEEDVGGGSLAAAMASRSFGLDTALAIAIAVADALAAVHGHGIVHKDVSPGNIVIGAGDSPSHGAIKLIDFGIASRLARESHDARSAEHLPGTLAYMSPEQTCRMNRAVDHRTDLYSLGATLYHLFANRPPFEADHRLELVHAHIARQPRPLHDVAPGVPRVVSDIVAKLLAKPLEDRYQSAAGVRHDLARCAMQRIETGDVVGFPLATADVALRFEVPQQRFGRARERDVLVGGFDRVAAGGSELLLVGGSSGIGKSSLVREVQRPIVERRGYFIAGKYDQFNRALPYSALTQAFGQLIETVVTEPAERIAAWRAALLDAVGLGGQILIDVIPALEAVIGPQPPVVALPPQEAQSRFNRLVQRFVAVFARADHPLVMFLDDLQWVDNPSLAVLESLLGEARPPHLFVVTAFRDNEVDAGHPFRIAVELIAQTGTRVGALTLAPLDPVDTTAMIAGTLRRSPGEVVPLALLLHHRTGGNPFFLIQLLHALHDAQLLRHDPARGAWDWQLDALLRHGVTSDILHVITERLARLPLGCRDLLRAAACIGNTFDLRTLATIAEAPYHVAARDLWPALRSGLIACDSADYQAAAEPVRDQLRAEIDAGRFNVRYRFLHDRVQQAAYQLTPEAERRHQHLRIGRLLLRWCATEAQRGELAFELTSQLNIGRDLIADPDERLTLAGLNARAGARAKAAAAHRAAAHHLAIAIELLGPDAWRGHHALMFQLHTALAESQYFNGEFAESDRLGRAAIAHGRDVLAKAEAYATRIQLFLSGARAREALDAGIEVLALLGFELPPDDAATRAACDAEGAKIAARLAGVDVARLVDLPAIKDPEKAWALELLVHTWAAAFFCQDVSLARLMVFWMVRTSLDHGHAAASAMAYTLHGMQLAMAGNYRDGYAFGMLGKQLNDTRFPSPVYTPRVRNIVANSINPFLNHLETNLELYRESYRIGPQVGDIFFSLWATFFMVLVRLTKGDPLTEVLAESDKYLKFVRDIKDRNIINVYELLRQTVPCLRGDTAALGSLDDGEFDEAARVAELEHTGFHVGVLWYGGFKAGVHVHLGQYERALEHAERAEQLLPFDIGMWSTTNHYFYQSIAMLQLYAAAEPATRTAYDAVLDRNLARFAAWAETCPVNFGHRHELLRAERARIDGNVPAAAAHYDAAIDLAAAGRFTSDSALALELAGVFYQGRGRDRIARIYLGDAFAAYERWGATAKTKLMAVKYAELAPRGRGADCVEHAVQRDAGNHWLDLVSVLKATQAISSEIAWDKLLAKVMAILTEHAGATRGVLVLDRRGALIAEVEASGRGATRIAAPLAEYPPIAHGVVNLVHRTRRSLVLDDVQRDARFLHDAYVSHVQPKSVLCVPMLHHGRLSGVAYFENNLSSGVFSVDRMAVLELMVSQAAISIENAMLYRDLESRVAERTEDLRREVEERHKIEIELRLAQKLESVGRLAAGVAHEINTPIQFVQSHVTFVREAAGDLLQIADASRALRAALPAGAGGTARAQLAALDDAADLDYLATRMPDALDQAMYGLDRVAKLVRSMKEFAHADQREKTASDINRALTATLTIAHNEYTYVADTAVELGDVPPVVCHISELNQCFLNLIVNAAHAISDVTASTGKRGVIGVRTWVEDALLVIAISDTGGGIPADIQDKIFDPFFTTKELGRGTGQGLAIARSVVVDKHGGTLTFETSPGRGTTFFIRLPIAAAQAAA